MGAIIYSGIEGIEEPEITLHSMGKYKKECDVYISKLRQICTAYNKGETVGEIIKFQVADGHAMYMVYSEKPLNLIHINIMDGWHSEFAELLTLTKVKEMVHKEKKLKELFS